MARSDPPTAAHRSADGTITYRQEYRRCGKPACSRCAPEQRGHGPYWYASWWESGRRRSRYLGKELPADLPVTAATAARDQLRVKTLGGFVVHRGETPLAWRSGRSLALFTALLSAPGYRLTRDQAMELLWPEADPGPAAVNLRSTIHRLRRILDVPSDASHLQREGDQLVLVPSGAAEWLDAAVFERLATRALAGRDPAPCRQALEWYAGEYLPEQRYDAWTEPARGHLQRLRIDLLLHLADLSAAQGEPAEAESALRQVLASDPDHEEAANTLMTLLASSGRGSEALRVYQALAQALEEDLDVAPGVEVEAVRSRIIAQRPLGRALRAPPTRRASEQTNLPAALTSFVGRDWELTEIADLLAHARLVTLVGPGGCGKTRLALEAAGRMVERIPDGVWLVELAGLGDAALVPSVVAGTLGIEEQPGTPVPETLCAAWREREMVLLLDNCEHLLGACADLVAALLAGCPRLRLLATSREALGVAGEVAYRVPSLATPDPEHPVPLDALAAYEAVALFVARAQAQRPGFALSASRAGAVTQICARLDGLPLAIELAAARVSVFSVEDIAQRLDDRFKLLAGGPRTALPRQQTLRATMEWSYSLLAPSEQALLRRLGVFASGWRREAAEAVCAGDDLPADAVLDRLGGLVQKSLVAREEQEGGTHYRMLETIREYARERLEESGELGILRRHHAGWYLALAELAREEFLGPKQTTWLARLEQEHDNLRSALRWASETGETEPGLRLAAALWRFWVAHGHLSEGRGWLEKLLAQRDSGTDGVDTLIRANALRAGGALASHQADFERATALHEESLTLYREREDQEGTSAALHNLGFAAASQGDYDRAKEWYEESLALKRELGNASVSASTLSGLGDVAMAVGEYERAAALCEEALVLWRSVGAPTYIGLGLQRLGEVRYRQGDSAGAAAALRESLAYYRDAGYDLYAAENLEVLGQVTCARGQMARAARLFGASAAMRERVGGPRETGKRPVHERAVGHTRAVLGEDAFAMAWAEGHAMSSEQAIPYALEEGPEGP